MPHLSEKENSGHVEDVHNQSDGDSIEKMDSMDQKTDHDVVEVDEIEEMDKVRELKRIIGEDDREALEKKFVRKLDIRMLPMIMLIYILNYLDRTNISTARLGGLEEETGLKGLQYNVIISVFFIGYVVMQIFTNLLLNKLRPSIFLPLVMTAWAVVSASCGAVQNYGGWVAIRFILGFVESPFFAGCIFLFSSWYTKKELATRIAIMYTAACASGAFGGLIGEAILNRFDHDNRGISSWRWLFIIEGTITVPIALMAMFILPDFPHNTRFLSEKERAVAQLRMIEEASKEDNYETQSLKDGALSVFLDPAMYMLWILQLSVVTATSVNSYFPTIVQTLGYDRTKTLLLTAPPWVLSGIWSLVVCLDSDKRKERYWHIVSSLVISMVGFIIAASTMNTAARYVSMHMMLMVYGAFTTNLSWISTTLSRPPAKRAVAIAFINAFSNVSSTYASYFYPAKTGPRYLEGMVCQIAFCALGIVSATVAKFYLTWRNKQLDKANEEDLATEGKRGGSRSTALAKRWDCDIHYRFIV